MNAFLPKSKLQAITKSGINLGKVSSIEIDTRTGRIQSFNVTSSHVIPRLLDEELLIGWDQIIDWKDEVIMVADAVVPSGAKNIALSQAKKMGAHLSEI